VTSKRHWYRCTSHWGSTGTAACTTWWGDVILKYTICDMCSARSWVGKWVCSYVLRNRSVFNGGKGVWPLPRSGKFYDVWWGGTYVRALHFYCFEILKSGV
jgi:hypothetical protein